VRTGPTMRTLLVIIDESEEASAALRFAARQAAASGGGVHLLALVAQQSFSAFGAVQATIEAEARDRAEMLAHAVAGNLLAESGIMPTISVMVGSSQKIVTDYLAQHPDTAALVLGAAKGSNPGPMVTHFSSVAGTLPCPLFIIPAEQAEGE
jgi:hypothetical protein